MTKFKVGDKVRVLNASEIIGAKRGELNDGDITTIHSFDTFGDPRLNTSLGALAMLERELEYIELIPQKPTKKQRIKTLESEVAELKAKVEALEKAQAKPKFVPVTTDNIAVGDKIRVIDKDGIGPAVLTNGKVYEVELRDTDGDFYVIDDEGDEMSIVESEFPYVEKVVSE